jgi:uncharacterized protein YbjT (DUF2867 family)
MASGIAYTEIAPNSFMQNDLMVKDAILAGFYPSPIGNVGVSAVDVGDIADAAINALTQNGFEGLTIALVGPEALTANGIARLWSEHLGRDVRYTGDDLDAWSAQVSQYLPGWMVKDLRVMFQHFIDRGLKATSDEVAQTAAILGRPPRSFETFVQEVAPQWLASVAG